MALYSILLLDYYYVVVAATVGVPHESVKLAVLGGITVTIFAGAVPKLLNGELVAVPPEMLSADPAPDPPGSLQVDVNTNCVPDPAVFAWI